jgi:hypothetical protein
MDRLIRYFDLQSARRAVITEAYNAGARIFAPVLPQYLVICLGVVAEPYLRGYIASGTWHFEWSAFWGRVVFGLLIGIVILPAVYKSAFDPSKPVLVQLAALFPMGIGWQSLVSTAAKGLTTATTVTTSAGG